MLDAAGQAARSAGVGVAVVVAANRTRHPLDANTLARLATQYAGQGVVGFGLSNDERRAQARDFERAFRIAKRADLLAVPHGGELLGPRSVAQCVDDLGADSLDTVELVMALEEEFECEIPDEEAEKITSVQQAIDYIKAHVKA